MRGNELVYDRINLLHYKLDKIGLNCGGSYIGSPEWLKNEKVTINSKNNDDKCFRYAVSFALNCEKINNHPERISNMKPFINEYNWKEINFTSNKKDLNEFEKKTSQ